MSGDRVAAAELARWAADRAPEMIARAEAAAVALLRDALVAASLDRIEMPDARDASRSAPGGGSAPPSGGPGRAREEPIAESSGAPAPTGPTELLWAYGVLRAADPVPSGLAGVAQAPPTRVTAKGLTALISRVPATEFGSDALSRNLNDLTWLERVARAHEAVLDAVLGQSTIVPLRMCTIFESEPGVIEMLERRQESLSDALAAIDGRLEWAVKVLVDPDRVIDLAEPEVVVAGDADPAGEGRAYLRRRRGERDVRQSAGRLAADIAQQVHARLQDWAIDARTFPPQNREISGHQGEMILNGAYLIDRERTEELSELVAELEAHHREHGARIELSGPWPPYNFVASEDAPSLP